MHNLLEKIKKEWELWLFGAAVVFSLLVILLGVCKRPRTGWSFGRGAVSVERESALTDSSFAFLNQGEAAVELKDNPFDGKFVVPVAPKPTPRPAPAHVPVAQPVEPPKVEEPVVEAPAPQPPPKTVAIAPQPRRVVGVVTFNYMNTNASGKNVAVFTIQTSKDQWENLALGVNETGCGVKVLAVTEDAVLLLDASGRRHKVVSSQGTKLWVTITE